MKALFLSDCLGTDNRKILNPSRHAFLVGDEPFKVYKEAYGKEGSQSDIDRLVQSTTLDNGKSFIDSSYSDALNYLKGIKSSTDASTPPTTDSIITNAQKLLDFQKQANQPIVSALQGQQGPLDQRYKDLVASIKGNQQVATNRQTLATNNELGRRGIGPNSGLYDREMNDALLPVDATFNSQLVQANEGYGNDVLDLALKISGAQAGNPLEALTGGQNLYNTQVNSANLARQFAEDQRQFNEQKALRDAQTKYYNAQATKESGSNSSTSLSSLWSSLFS